MEKKISIILIGNNEDHDSISTQLEAISSQSLSPKEVIFVDTSKRAKSVDNFAQKLPREIKFQYFNIGKNYPGAARNFGVKKSSHSILGFLDMMTIPTHSWLKDSIALLEDRKKAYVTGLTNFHSKKKFDELYKLYAYGNVAYETVPGTLIFKDDFLDVGLFREDIRSSEDIIWKDEAKKKLNTLIPSKNNLNYFNLPSSIIELTKRYIIYSFFGSISKAKSIVKDVYLSIFVLLGFLIVPRWNYLIGGWDEENFFYIDDITKKFYLLILVVFIVLQAANYFFNLKKTLFFEILRYVFLVTIFIIIFQWNAVIANWVEKSSLYIPNITKIFVSSCIIASITLRGIIIPLHRKVRPEILFPKNWLLVGLLGLYLDLIKAPIYIFGSIYLAFLSSIYNLFRKRIS